MQICKSPYMYVFIEKSYPENFAFLILGIHELYIIKNVKFSGYYFCMNLNTYISIWMHLDTVIKREHCLF